ncbi:hypothetical protein [Sorangium sp. So ce854]
MTRLDGGGPRSSPLATRSCPLAMAEARARRRSGGQRFARRVIPAATR